MTANTDTISKAAPSSSGLKSELKEVKLNAAILRDDLADTGHHIAAAARAGVTEVRDRGIAAAGAVRDRATDAAVAVRRRGADQVETAQLWVMERPLTAVAIAFGVGALVGLFGRRSR